MQQLNIQEAFDFYKKFILDYANDKTDIYTRYGFNLQGSVGSKDWEVFAAILLSDKAKPGDGADLMNHEVKSALLGNSFEYQYHKNHGLEKLEEDKTIDHIFISRSKTYSDIFVWLVSHNHLVSTFNSWLPELRQNYTSGTKQRFRRSINHSFVKKHGKLILKIQDGQLVNP